MSKEQLEISLENISGALDLIECQINEDMAGFAVKFRDKDFSRRLGFMLTTVVMAKTYVESVKAVAV